MSSCSRLRSPSNQPSRISDQQRLAGGAQGEGEYVGVVPAAGAACGLGVRAQRRADAGHLVGGDRGAGAGPAAHDALLGASLGDVAGGQPRWPTPSRRARSSSSAPCSSGSWPRRRSSSTRASATPVRSSVATETFTGAPPAAAWRRPRAGPRAVTPEPPEPVAAALQAPAHPHAHLARPAGTQVHHRGCAPTRLPRRSRSTSRTPRRPAPRARTRTLKRRPCVRGGRRAWGPPTAARAGTRGGRSRQPDVHARERQCAGAALLGVQARGRGQLQTQA